MIRRLAALLAFVLVSSLVPATPASAYEPHVLRYADTLELLDRHVGQQQHAG
jgi:hypothetical protein